MVLVSRTAWPSASVALSPTAGGIILCVGELTRVGAITIHHCWLSSFTPLQGSSPFLPMVPSPPLFPHFYRVPHGIDASLVVVDPVPSRRHPPTRRPRPWPKSAFLGLTPHVRVAVPQVDPTLTSPSSSWELTVATLRHEPLHRIHVPLPRGFTTLEQDLTVPAIFAAFLSVSQQDLVAAAFGADPTSLEPP